MTLDKRGYGEVPPVRRSVSSFMVVGTRQLCGEGVKSSHPRFDRS